MRKKPLEKVGNLFDRLLDLSAFVLGGALGLIGISVCFSVFCRYFLNRPQIWVIGATEYTLAIVTFLGAAWLLRDEGHVNIDIAVNLFHPKTKDAVNILTSLLGAMLSLILCWYSSAASLDHFRRGVLTMSAIPFPLGPLLLIQAVSFFILFIQFLRRSYRYLKNWKALREREEREVDISSEF
ncbi:TRAP transporter small permease [bacterium]|nr:TRAP transporter small permease [bacterium]